MGKVAGGDIRQFKYGGREFDVAPDCSLEITPHGYTNENKPAGNGELVVLQKRTLAAIDGIELVMRNSKGDLEYLQNKQGNGEPTPVLIGLVDGTTWSGAMSIEGEVKYKTDSGQASFALRGKTLEQI